MKIKKTIIWDMDGVIVDSEPLHFRTTNELITKKLNIPKFSYEEYKKTFGMGDEEIFTELSKKYNLNINPKQLAKDREKLFCAHLDEVKTIPGVIDKINEFSKKYNQVLASSTIHKIVNDILKKFGIKDYFQMVLSRNDIHRSKPDPEIYLRAVKGVNSNKDKCVIIEDAQAGINAGKTAGVKVIAITTNFKKDEIKNADLIIDSFSDLTVDKIEDLLC